nr:MAG TPA: hypothetical protein [Caudoviricetes sp.]
MLTLPFAKRRCKSGSIKQYPVVSHVFIVH